MKTLATLQKRIKSGTSSWSFIQNANAYFALNNEGKSIIVNDINELRALYKRMQSYGYASVIAN